MRDACSRRRAQVADALSARGLPEVGVWGRGVDCELFGPERRDDALRARLLRRRRPAGALGRPRCRTRSGSASCSTRSRASPRERPDVRLVVVGDGPGAARAGAHRARAGPSSSASCAATSWRRSTRAPTSSASRARPTPSARCMLEAGASGLPVVAAAAGGAPRARPRTARPGCSCRPTTPARSRRRCSTSPADPARRTASGPPGRAAALERTWDAASLSWAASTPGSSAAGPEPRSRRRSQDVTVVTPAFHGRLAGWTRARSSCPAGVRPAALYAARAAGELGCALEPPSFAASGGVARATTGAGSTTELATPGPVALGGHSMGAALAILAAADAPELVERLVLDRARRAAADEADPRRASPTSRASSLRGTYPRGRRPRPSLAVRAPRAPRSARAESAASTSAASARASAPPASRPPSSAARATRSSPTATRGRSQPLLGAALRGARRSPAATCGCSATSDRLAAVVS